MARAVTRLFEGRVVGAETMEGRHLPCQGETQSQRRRYSSFGGGVRVSRQTTDTDLRAPPVRLPSTLKGLWSVDTVCLRVPAD